jgi:hypothetical protein
VSASKDSRPKRGAWPISNSFTIQLPVTNERTKFSEHRGGRGASWRRLAFEGGLKRREGNCVEETLTLGTMGEDPS